MAKNEKQQSAEETVETKEKETAKKTERKEKLNEKILADKEKEIEELKAKISENEDKYLRMLAEYDNFRKRAQKEKDSMYAEGKADCIEKLLEVLDTLERATLVDIENSTAKSLLDGVVKVLEMASSVFEKLGVEEIKAKGEKFDPNFHNAVMHDENDEFEENTVSEVFLKGYKMGDKVIRHSVVKVSN